MQTINTTICDLPRMALDLDDFNLPVCLSDVVNQYLSEILIKCVGFLLRKWVCLDCMYEGLRIFVFKV